MQKLSFGQKFIFWINSIFVVLLLIAKFAPAISPQTFWVYALFGLVFPFLAIINFAFLLYWSFKRHLAILFPLIALLICFPQIKRTFAAANFLSSDRGSRSLKVMSYNVKNFDLYNWKNNEHSRDEMMEIIKSEDPDLIAFQEFYTQSDHKFHNIKKLINQLGFVDYHFDISLSLNGYQHWGMAVFSKYPISNKGSITFEGTKANKVAYCDIAISSEEHIRVFNTHLQSFMLSDKDVKYIEKFKDNHKDWSTPKNILRKLKYAFQQRSKQVNLLQEAIEASPHPVLVCGDFNDTPVSYAYEKVASGLKDSFREAGWGIGCTYAGLFIPFRIDYILSDPQFQVTGHKVIRQRLSDHYPILASFELPYPMVVSR